MALCSYIKIHQLATRVVLLSCSAQAREYLLGMYAGATRVISKPCGNNLIVGRIVEALRQPVPPGGTGTSSELPYRVSHEATAIPRDAATPMSQRVSKSLGKAVRFVTDRLTARVPATPGNWWRPAIARSPAPLSAPAGQGGPYTKDPQSPPSLASWPGTSL